MSTTDDAAAIARVRSLAMSVSGGCSTEDLRLVCDLAERAIARGERRVYMPVLLKWRETLRRGHASRGDLARLDSMLSGWPDNITEAEADTLLAEVAALRHPDPEQFVKAADALADFVDKRHLVTPQVMEAYRKARRRNR